jgi:ceramide glucosyltransferase
VDIRVVVGKGRPTDGNPKVANLLDMIHAADKDVLVIADSDMKVGPTYLKAVAASLMQPDVGVATCLYVSHPAGGLCSRLGAMGVNHNFLPSVLVGQAVGRVDGCFGATLALTRATLDEIGGLEPLKDQLADDYMIGALVRKKGHTIALIPLLPTTIADEP